MYVQLLLVACTLQLGSFQGLSDVRNSTVCYNDARMRTETLACGAGGFINVLHVKVGYFSDCSNNHNGCLFEEISPGNAYYQHILLECNGKTACLLNSTVVREQRFKKGFNICTGLYVQDRNAVKLDYNCKGNPSTTTGSAVATETELILTYSTPSEEKTPQGSSSSSTTDRTESEPMSGAKEKQVMFLPLTTILGIVGGSVIVLALLCLGMVLLLRHRRKSQHDQHKKKGSMAANTTDDFTYYSTISGDGGKNPDAPTVKARPLPVLNLPPAEGVYQHAHYDDINVYSELDSPTYQDPSNQATNDLYSLCEPSPPCACLTNQRRDTPVDLVNNSLYHKAYETSTDEDEH